MSENYIPKSSPYISENNRLKGVSANLNEEIDIKSNKNNKGEKNTTIIFKSKPWKTFRDLLVKYYVKFIIQNISIKEIKRDMKYSRNRIRLDNINRLTKYFNEKVSSYVKEIMLDSKENKFRKRAINKISNIIYYDRP